MRGVYNRHLIILCLRENDVPHVLECGLYVGLKALLSNGHIKYRYDIFAYAFMIFYDNINTQV